VTRAFRVYRLNLYRRTRNRAVRKATSQYVLAAADDAEALEGATALHAKIIARAAFAELINDQGGAVANWAGGVAQDAQTQAAKAEVRSPLPADIQWGGAKVSHWVQTRSFMLRMVRVTSISGL
jgi:hypothetical protein